MIVLNSVLYGKTTLILLVYFLGLTSFKTSENLIGHWKIVKLEVDGRQTDNLPFDWVTFNNDEIIEIGSHGRMSCGTWNFNEKSKLLWLEIEKKGEYLVIQKISKKKLTIKSGETIMILKKE